MNWVNPDYVEEKIRIQQVIRVKHRRLFHLDKCIHGALMSQRNQMYPPST